MADIFGKVKDSLNKGVVTVSTGSKSMLEKTKINSMIKTLEEEKKKLIEALGNKTFTYFCANPEKDLSRAEVFTICNEIHIRNEQIAQYNKRIAELDAEMDLVKGNASKVNSICQCGFVNKPDAKFCVKCGSKLM